MLDNFYNFHKRYFDYEKDYDTEILDWGDLIGEGEEGNKYIYMNKKNNKKKWKNLRKKITY